MRSPVVMKHLPSTSAQPVQLSRVRDCVRSRSHNMIQRCEGDCCRIHGGEKYDYNERTVDGIMTEVITECLMKSNLGHHHPQRQYY